MKAKHHHYIERINQALDFIDQNLGMAFTLDELSAVANFSKYHFHRIFFSIVGEAPFEYVLRLRLERAASMLKMPSNNSLTEIAYQCGFSDLSIFSRNFKKHFGIPPSAYKNEAQQKSNKSQMESNSQQVASLSLPYFCPESQTIKWTSTMEFIKNVEVKDRPMMTVAYNRSLGPYAGNNALYQKHRSELFAWAASKKLLNQKGFNYLVLYHDNPTVSLNNSQRMSLCVTIPTEVETGGSIGKMEIEHGEYLICQCELAAKDFPQAWNWIYEVWFPNSNYVPAQKPYYELYPEQPKGEVFRVDFYIPVEETS